MYSKFHLVFSTVYSVDGEGDSTSTVSPPNEKNNISASEYPSSEPIKRFCTANSKRGRQ
jgi:hypothetical protein